MARRFPPEVVEYIETHAPGTSYRDMISQVGQLFGIPFTVKQMHNFFHNHHLKNGNPTGGKLGSWSRYPPEVPEMITSMCAAGKCSTEIAEAINARLGEGTITPKHVASWKKNHKVRSGYQGFRKGMKSPCKGKHWDDFMSKEAQKRSMANLFPAGHVPDNLAPIGEIRKTTDGYLVKKVSEYGNQRSRWRFLHRLIWEEANGPIPEGHYVCFADGDRTNCCLENLYLETRAQHAIRNRRGWKSYDQESARALNTMADLMAATAAHKRRRKG